MRRLLDMGTAFNDFLKTKQFRCRTATECLQWLFVLQRLIRNGWQARFETDIIREPEYYQRHAFVIKKTHDRVLLLSNSWLYNVDVTYKPTVIKGIKWVIPIASLTNITINVPHAVSNDVNHDHTGDNAPYAILAFDEKIATSAFDAHHKSYKTTDFKKKDHSFLFRTLAERNKLV